MILCDSCTFFVAAVYIFAGHLGVENCMLELSSCFM